MAPRRSFTFAFPAHNGHFGSEYVMVARKQEYLPPFEWTPEQIAVFKANDLKPCVFSERQMAEFDKQKLPYFKFQSAEGDLMFNFYTKDQYQTDDKMRQYMTRAQYIPPPGVRIWTDDYSNVLSVFRW